MLRSPPRGRALALFCACLAPLSALAADHNEAPGTKNEKAADITDLYAWHEGTNLFVILDVAGHTLPDQTAGTYDDKVLYTILFDTNADATPDKQIFVRFGKSSAGAWGVQVKGLPGASGTVEGAVETVIDGGGGTKVHAGYHDDPFFFDVQGFKETLQAGTPKFDSTRDGFAGENVTAIALQMPLSAIGAGQFQVWATTGRKP